MSKLGRPLIKKAESTLEMALAQILHRILPLIKNKIPVAYNLIFFFCSSQLAVTCKKLVGY